MLWMAGISLVPRPSRGGGGGGGGGGGREGLVHPQRPGNKGRQGIKITDKNNNVSTLKHSVYTIIMTDCRELSESYVEDLGIQYMADRTDEFDNRSMLMGEVGCFLSHHSIWEKVSDISREAMPHTHTRGIII